MRPIFAAAVVAGVGFLTFDASSTDAAVISVGPPNGSTGNFQCMDVSGNDLGINPDGSVSPVPVQVFDCHASGAQQFQWAGPQGRTIYALSGQRCLTVPNGEIAPKTPVYSLPCDENDPTLSQQFYFIDGMIIYVKSGDCLDAGDMQNSTQLVIDKCSTTNSPSQQWQIK